MPKIHQKKHSPHTAKQLYDLVLDFKKYPEFLPWCEAVRLKSQNGNVSIADTVIGYKVFHECFTTEITAEEQEHTISIRYVKGPFKAMSSSWHFTDSPAGGCTIDFKMDFEFKSFILQKALNPFFEKAMSAMISAFEKRAGQIYPCENP